MKLMAVKKIALGILAFSLLVPITPGISLAKAKLCCKKLCPKQVKTPPPKCHGSKAAIPLEKSEPGNCCKTDCLQAVLNTPVTALTYTSGLHSVIQLEKNYPDISESVPVSLYRAPPNGFSIPRSSIFSFPVDPPLFLMHASFLI